MATPLDLSHTRDFSDPVRRAITEEVTRLVLPMAKTIATGGFLKEDTDSFGWALANPAFSGHYENVWDNPSELIFATGGYGPKADGYAANAACKIRPAARTGRDTLDLNTYDKDEFQDLVESQSSMTGDFQWGDFPHGGAVIIDINGIVYIAAVSCWDQDEDMLGASMVGGAAGVGQYRFDQRAAVSTN